MEGACFSKKISTEKMDLVEKFLQNTTYGQWPQTGEKTKKEG
jgi:hypothetical protein